MKNLLYILIAFILLLGCRTKKKVTEEKKETVQKDTVVKIKRQTDTVFKDRVITKTKPVYSDIVVDNPCDSLGVLKNFKINSGSGNNKNSVFSKDGKIYISQKIDSTENKFESKYKSRWRQDSIDLRKQLIQKSESNLEKVRVVWPWWLWVAIIAGGLSILLNLYQRFRPF